MAKTATRPTSRNMRLLSQHSMGGFGNCGEGLAIQLTRDGRRILWHRPRIGADELHRGRRHRPAEAARVVADRPAARQDALELARRRRATRWPSPTRRREPRADARRRRAVRRQRPDQPALRSLSSTRSGPHSRGVHYLWFVDGEYVHMRARRRRLRAAQPERRPVLPHHRRAQPARPGEVGRWWLPGTREGDPEPPPLRHHDVRLRLPHPQHQRLPAAPGPRVRRLSRRRPGILDIADKGKPKLVEPLGLPPADARLHATRVLPLFESRTCSSSPTNRRGRRRRTGRSSCGSSTRARRTSWCRSAPARSRRSKDFGRGGGRFGAHNLHENRPLPTALRSDTIVSARSSTAACAPSTSPTRSSRARSRGRCRRPPGTRRPSPSAQRRACRRADRDYTVDRLVGGLYCYELKV